METRPESETAGANLKALNVGMCCHSCMDSSNLTELGGAEEEDGEVRTCSRGKEVEAVEQQDVAEMQSPVPVKMSG